MAGPGADAPLLKPEMIGICSGCGSAIVSDNENPTLYRALDEAEKAFVRKKWPAIWWQIQQAQELIKPKP